MAQDIAPDRLQAMVHVVPLAPVDSAIGVNQRGVVVARVDVAPEHRQAVQHVEDRQADHVVVYVLGCGCVFGLEGELRGGLAVDPEVVAIFFVSVIYGVCTWQTLFAHLRTCSTGGPCVHLAILGILSRDSLRWHMLFLSYTRWLPPLTLK